ncbi:MAG TPA: 6-phosphofructokinase, partial [Vicinamibacteria bacterium]|nr:6-phosphofructokinase [Vicinamibacteria bacterium]
MKRLRLAVNTGGGDAPGLNAVVRAITLAALNRGYEVFGIRKGYLGLLDTSQLMPLTFDSVRGITHLGGSILGTNNRGNPLGIRVVENGQERYVDVSDQAVEAQAVEVLHRLVGHVHVALAPLLLHADGQRVAAVVGAEDGAAQVGD